MTTLARKTVLAAFSVTLLVALASTASATGPNARLLHPDHDCLPTFGFSSFNIHGVGERVTNVRWNGLAARIGLERGDMILSMNGFPLTYHGAWNDALREAVYHGGRIKLRIRDVRTGRIAYRETFVGNNGPIAGPVTPKMHVGNYHSPVVHHDHHHVEYPVGPITPKSKPSNDLNLKIKKIANLFD